MSKKIFAVSDIHSAFTPLKKALNEKGFDEKNSNHWLFVCGDAFDRMNESEDVLKFLTSLERKVLIKGNHDSLLFDCCNRGFCYSHDIHNGTVKTILDLGEANKGNTFDKCCEITLNKLIQYRSKLVNYFETQKYIFVHSWIPTFETGYREDWRNANDSEWEEAMWGNPFKKWLDGLNKTGKIIVFGHWHCSTGHRLNGNGSEFGTDAVWDPFYGDNIIAIDRCTARTKECNVIVLEDDF